VFLPQPYCPFGASVFVHDDAQSLIVALLPTGFDRPLFTKRKGALNKSIYARSYSEVKSKIAKLKAAPSTQRQLTSLVNMEQLSFMWLDDKKIQIKESTYARYYQVIYSHIVPYFNTRPVLKLAKRLKLVYTIVMDMNEQKSE
jgi:hypothetical protein